MPIYFIRHGESQANEQNRFAGRLNAPLTSLGIRQAHQAAQRVAALGTHIDELHVSPLDRARNTAEIIMEAQARQPERTVVSEDLVERDFGDFSGRNKSLVKKTIGFAAYTEYFHSHTGCPPGGESWEAMYERTAAYYHNVLLPASRSGRTVLVVCHKYIVEMFALVVAGVPVEQVRDFKIPNARPLSEEDLRKAVGRPAAAGFLNNLGEIVEIRLPLLVASAAVLGMVVQLLVGYRVPPWLFSTLMTAFLAVGSFFTMLRVDPRNLRGALGSIRPIVPLLLVRLAVGLVLLWTSRSLEQDLAGLFFLLPSALLTPTLSLLWGGDYFFSVRLAVASSLLLPAVLLGAVVIPMGVPMLHGLPLGALTPALGSYGAVLVAALVVPGVGAQLLRRRDPIRAGSVSTNWNWLGGLTLVPLAGLATFTLTPPTGLTHHGELTSLLTAMAVTVAAHTALRLLALAFLHGRRRGVGLGRDIFITQNTPNIFLWLAMASVLAPVTAHQVSVTGLGMALVFFLAMYGDERVFLVRHRREMRTRRRHARRRRAALAW
ncbi:MAG: histidine phosphatase family protein [Streptomycetaceae bacterium]|nr:histidine phosphatase family protein [Streptomycetaceae bacterium]